jgi:hypothetical protein
LNLAPDNILSKFGITKGKDGKVYVSPTTDYLLNALLPQYALTQRGFSGTENTPYQNLSSGLGIKLTPYDPLKAESTYNYNWGKEASLSIGNYQQLQGDVNGVPYQLPSTSELQSVYKNRYKEYVANKPEYKDILEIKALSELVGSDKDLNAWINKKLKPYYAEIDALKGKSLNDLKIMLQNAGIELNLNDVESIIKANKQEE